MCELSKLESNENSWKWMCYDQSDEIPAVTLFAIRFTKKVDVPKFKEVFESLLESNNKLDWPKKSAEAGEKKETEEKKEGEDKKDE